ncbi:hypothetical protein U1E44_04710 [Arenibacter sp. GZD96]|nr:hypothetical protein [Arenibacter sp. GZD-96]MEA1785384.1 hypothetical protein [Arenibacter sp. GZD-96]
MNTKKIVFAVMAVGMLVASTYIPSNDTDALGVDRTKVIKKAPIAK